MLIAQKYNNLVQFRTRKVVVRQGKRVRLTVVYCSRMQNVDCTDKATTMCDATYSGI